MAHPTFSFELILQAEIKLKNGETHHRIVRTGCCFPVHMEIFLVDIVYNSLIEILKSKSKERRMLLQVREYKKFKYLKGSIFFLMAEQELFDILQEWRMRFGVVEQAEVYFVDSEICFTPEDIEKIEVERVGLDYHDGKGTTKVEIF
jgi:hypothetical protein